MSAKSPTIYRLMTAGEREMARALGRVTFVPGIRSKALARALAAEAELPPCQITEKQAEALRSLVRRYRRQILPAIVALAAPIPTRGVS